MTALLEVKDLVLEYRHGPQFGPLSFEINEGEAFALVGESGAGKSTLAFALLDVLRFKGGRRLKGKITMRCAKKEIAYIPQDPAAALDPLFPVGEQMRELGCPKSRIQEVLHEVNLPLDHFSLKSYPHELSGGMLQRLLIAMALARSAKLLIADEPTSSLDVIHQAGIMDLFRSVKKQKISILYITHHLPLAMALCPRIAVLYQGKIVEMGGAKEIYENPGHAFTQKLILAVPRLEIT